MIPVYQVSVTQISNVIDLNSKIRYYSLIIIVAIDYLQPIFVGLTISLIIGQKYLP